MMIQPSYALNACVPFRTAPIPAFPHLRRGKESYVSSLDYATRVSYPPSRTNVRGGGPGRGHASFVMLALAAVLSGCASYSKDGGFDTVRDTASQRLGKTVSDPRTASDLDQIQTEVRALLARPLGPEDAVQIALLSNRGLRAMYSDLGISEGDLVQAGRLQNPRFTTTRTRASDGDFKYETALTVNMINLLTMPLALKIERQRFEAVQLAVASEVLRLGLETRRAWFEAVATQQAEAYYGEVLEAAEASAELGRRMARVGNFSRRDQLREQLFYADAAAQLARAKTTSVAAREKLTRLMGLWGEDARFTLAQRLPDLPGNAAELPDVEAFAIGERLDIRAAKANAAGVAQSLGLTKATRFVNVFDLGPATVMESNEQIKKGYTITIELPLFDWGGARTSKAEAIYRQSLERVAETAINARSEVREAYTTYRYAWDVARHYRDEIVPLRKRIGDENLLRYNGMLISVFELLADVREQVTAVNGYIEALRDYWVAETELQQALGGRLPSVLAGTIPPPAPSKSDRNG
jgi:outer membrane protein TolC